MLIKTKENNKSCKFPRKSYFSEIKMLIIIYPEQMEDMTCFCCFPDKNRS